MFAQTLPRPWGRTENRCDAQSARAGNFCLSVVVEKVFEARFAVFGKIPPKFLKFSPDFVAKMPFSRDAAADSGYSFALRGKIIRAEWLIYTRYTYRQADNPWH